MLQQTQVVTVIPYYERFLNRFPDIQTLAQAPLDQVLHYWAGLGYYARARHLHQAAQIILAEHQGQFPTDFDHVIRLPGIGRSTAGAILALSKRQRYPILDGNVKRVLCRAFAVKGWPGHSKVQETLWALSERLTPRKNVQHYTQAMMDIGATVCTRANPQCHRCPLSAVCKARVEGTVQLYPEPKPRQEKPIRQSVLLILNQVTKHQVLLTKRPPTGIWGGLWSFPEYAMEVASETNAAGITNWCRLNFGVSLHSQSYLPTVRHTFTHFHLDIYPLVCTVRAAPKALSGDQMWYKLGQPLKMGVAAPIKRLLESLV